MKRLAATTLAVMGIAAWATPSWATYSVPISAFSEGTGKASAGQYEIAFTVGQASPIGTGASGSFALISGIVPTVMDVVPPEIIHEPLALAAERTAVAVQADIEDRVTGVNSVSLYYREGGLTNFKTRSMEIVSGSTYEAEIPASAVTERGLVYYIEATDGMGNRSTVPAGAPDSLENLPVYFAALTSDVNMPSGEYRMISLPGTPTDGSPDSILADDLGSYDKKVWRLGRWNPSGQCTTGCYDEYPEIADFAPGRAYWLILESSRPFDFSGISTDVSRPAPIRLETGWNQIGTPYAFATDWSSGWVIFDGQKYSIGEEHVVGADTIMVENNLIAYDGTYQSFQSQLGGWSGYWLFNAGTREVDIAFPPRIVLAQKMGAPFADEGMDVLFGIEVSHAGSDKMRRESVCYAGLAEDARDAWDPHDLHSPPPLDRYLSATFRHSDWGRLSGGYMLDVREPSGNGEIYVITVEASHDAYARVEITPHGAPPHGWGAALYDRARGIKVTDFDQPYMLEVHEQAELELWVGTEEFLAGEAIESNMELRTQLLSLIPNPFREEVAVSFHLSSPQRVTVDVYSIEGTLVACLADGILGGGVHTRTWNGKTSSGDDAAPGVYFLRMLADDTRKTGKIIKLK
jgi:hypothetical protein